MTENYYQSKVMEIDKLFKKIINARQKSEVTDEEKIIK